MEGEDMGDWTARALLDDALVAHELICMRDPSQRFIPSRQPTRPGSPMETPTRPLEEEKKAFVESGLFSASIPRRERSRMIARRGILDAKTEDMVAAAKKEEADVSMGKKRKKSRSAENQRKRESHRLGSNASLGGEERSTKRMKPDEPTTDRRDDCNAGLKVVLSPRGSLILKFRTPATKATKLPDMEASKVHDVGSYKLPNEAAQSSAAGRDGAVPYMLPDLNLPSFVEEAMQGVQ